MRWEWIALQLARDAGIRVPESKLHVIDDKPVLVVDRFDREGAAAPGVRERNDDAGGHRR